MKPDEYLKSVLDSQRLDDDSKEMKDLRARREEVEGLLRDKFKDSSPTIRYGGSKAKNTLIRESYDLDLACYFPHDDAKAGETLKEVYDNVRDALKEKYKVQEKTSSLRIRSDSDVDFHVDVVPGRFTDDSKSDSYLHQRNGDKDRLKTNLDIHIAHVRDSGLTESICLMKLWRTRNSMSVRTFPLELLTIKLLSDKKDKGLSDQLEYLWTELRDRVNSISIEDPANPSGNDLSGLLSTEIRTELSEVARTTLKRVEKEGWESVYGPAAGSSEGDRRDALRQAAQRVPAQTKPWWPGA